MIAFIYLTTFKNALQIFLDGCGRVFEGQKAQRVMFTRLSINMTPLSEQNMKINLNRKELKQNKFISASKKVSNQKHQNTELKNAL